MKSFNQVELDIIHWAEARKIIPNSTPPVQLLKMMSEMGELCDAEIKNNDAEIKDAVGDIVVCLLVYCDLRKIGLLKCVCDAYDVIKNRKGTLLENGTFVKEQS